MSEKEISNEDKIFEETKKEENLSEEVFICECHSLEHMVAFWYDDFDKNVHLEVHLTNRGFFRRIWIGIKYIFGYKCRYGEWDSFIVKPNDAQKIKKWLDKSIENY
jgi:hypothetical protein